MAKYDYEDRSKNSFLRNLGMGLSEGAMAMGQGMTGQPYLTNFNEIQLKRAEAAKKNTYEAAMAEFLQGIKGGQGGMGVTGATLGKDGVSLTVGQLPEAKSKQEIKTQVAKDAMGRVQKLQELIPVLDQFDSYLSAVPVGVGLEGRMQGLGLAMSAPIQTNPFVATAMTQLDALRPQIARGFGDVGNLSQSEQQTAKKFIPQTSDNADTRILKGLGGLTFIRRKLTNASEKAGLNEDTDYQKVMGELDKRISNQFSRALELGVDGKKMSDFLGVGKLGMGDIPMTKEIASAIVKQSGGNKEKARKMAKDMGLKF